MSHGATDNDGLGGFDSRAGRALHQLSSVILAELGQKVQRLGLFLNTEFESFHDDSLEEEGVRHRYRRLLGLRRRLRVDAEVAHTVLKCSLAYLVASLAVYWRPFNDMMGSTDSKHVVATAAVYFHPARTKGSMHQLLVYVFVLLLFSFVVALVCRSTSAHFFREGEDEVSYGIDLVVSSVGFGVIAFMKQKVAKRTFNTACSLASISLATCIVKEGLLNSSAIPMRRLLSTSHVVAAGSLVLVAICYLVWPQLAEACLRASLNDAFNAMSAVLSVTTHRFLNGEKMTAQDEECFAALATQCANLATHLEETSYELRVVGKEAQLECYVQIVDAANALRKHLQALRSSCEMQWLLLHRALSSGASLNSFRSVVREANLDTEYEAVYLTQLFDLFVYYLAPSIKLFVFTVKEVLSAVPFEKKYVGDVQSVFVKLANYQISLMRAIELFQQKQVKLFEKLYSQDIFQADNFDFKTDQEEVTACCGNFLGLLTLYGEHLVRFLRLTEEYEVSAKRPRTWRWTRFWTRAPAAADSSFVDALRELKSQIRPGARDDEGARFRVWRLLRFLRRTDVQFGVRVGVGAFAVSSFAFMPRTRGLFVTWRLEWALVVYCIMMNKSLGGTTMTAKWRFLGTFLGCFIAWAVWAASDGNAYALAATGFLLSLPCFYIINFWTANEAYGRFILLTYNLTALYSYSMVQNDAEDNYEGGDTPLVFEIAYHRFLAVSIGIVWALTVASVFLPTSARVRLKLGLTVLWLRMGVTWNSDPLSFSKGPGGLRLNGVRDKTTSEMLGECHTLLKQAPNEFRLKGTFPKEKYQKLLASTLKILDAFQNIRLLVEVDPALTENEEYVLEYIGQERDELEHRIFLNFYVLASAMALGFPLPTKPASTEHAKDRMLFKLSEIRTQSEHVLTNDDYVLLYLYILVTNTITLELDRIAGLVRELLGNVSEEMFLLA